MEKCFKCQTPETRAFDAIVPEGIKKICGKCSSIENVPMVNERFTFQSQKQPTVYDRMKRISGITPEKRDDSQRKETEKILSKMVDSNFYKGFKDDLNLKKNLVDNFHWIILRGRRAKHLTQEQLAEKVGTKQSAIARLESGNSNPSLELLEKITKAVDSELLVQIK